MSQSPESKTASRRQFFKVASLGAVAAGAAGIGGVASTAPAIAAEASQPTAGYAETAHVKTYYALAK